MMHNLAARIVLNDARRALELWEEADEDEQLSRIYYASTLALLRAVGHVLRNVDSKSSTALAQAIQLRFEDLKRNASANPIFFEFIERERNSILKEYDFSAEQIDGMPLIVSDASGNVELCELPFPTYFISEGAFAGEDARDVAMEACEFWERYLDDVCALATSTE